MGKAERPRIGQKVTAILVRDQSAEVGSGVALGVDRTSVVLEMKTKQAEQYESSQVTLIYLSGERVMHWKLKCAAIVDDLRWALISEGDPTEGERRDFFRAEVDVRVAIRRGLNPDDDEAFVSLMDEAQESGLNSLEEQVADISGSGIKISCGDSIRPGEKFGVLIGIPKLSDRVYPVMAEAIRSRPDGTASTFVKISEEFQDLVVAAVFQARYDNLIV